MLRFPPAIRLASLALVAGLIGWAPLARAINIDPGSTASNVAAEGGNAVAQCTPTASPLVACSVEVRAPQNGLGLSAESGSGAASNASGLVFTTFTVPASSTGEAVLLAGSLTVTVSSTGDLSSGNDGANASASVRVRVVDPATGAVVADRLVVDVKSEQTNQAVDRDDAVTLPLVLRRGVPYRFELEGAVTTLAPENGPNSTADFATSGRGIAWSNLAITVGPDPFDRIAALEARVAQLETLTTEHTAQIAALQAENAAQQLQIDALIAENQAQQQQIDKLRHDLDTHTHVYLTGRGEGHNNTEVNTGTAVIPANGTGTGGGSTGGGSTPPPPPSGPARVLSLSASPSPATAGQATTVSASVNNVGQVEFKWAILRGSRWVVLSDYSSASSYSYTPAKPGSYRIGVFVRNVGSTRSYEDSESLTFRAQP